MKSTLVQPKHMNIVSRNVNLILKTNLITQAISNLQTSSDEYLVSKRKSNISSPNVA